MLNRVTLIGNLGADPQVREAGEDRKVANARLASRRRWKDRDGGRQEDTQWHQLVFWGRQAELAEQLLKKGQLVYVEGRLNTTTWTDKEDEERTHYRTEVVTESFLILSPKDALATESEAQV
jgi:single-strand DNA-binding protein